jgi:hypothetical protein
VPATISLTIFASYKRGLETFTEMILVKEVSAMSKGFYFAALHSIGFKCCQMLTTVFFDVVPNTF